MGGGGEDHDAVVAAYYADGGKKSERRVVHDGWLGLAVAEMPRLCGCWHVWHLCKRKDLRRPPAPSFTF